MTQFSSDAVLLRIDVGGSLGRVWEAIAASPSLTGEAVGANSIMRTTLPDVTH